MHLVGSIVKSVSGRDKKRIFAIVGVCSDNERVLIADGTLHKLSRPKAKNLRHLAVLAIADRDLTSTFVSDKELSEYLCRFEEELKIKKI